MRKGNTITLNTLRPNAVRMNGQPWAPGGPAGGGGGIVPLPPAEPEEPGEPEEPEVPETPPAGKYLVFEDPEAERVLMANGVSSDGVGITLEDAAAVTSISTWFKGNTAVASFPEFAYFTNCTALAANAFDGCTALAKITLPTSLASIGAYAMRNVPAPVVLDEPNLATIGTAAFYGSGLTEIKDLGKVQIIGSTSAVVQAASGVFANCKSLTKAHIPASVTHIGGMSFVGCTALTELTGCEGVTNIVRQQAFDGCSGLVGALTLPSVTLIDQYSFRNCKFSTIDLGTDTATIAAYAFQNNTTLERIICRATTPPSLGNTNALSGTNNCPIYVPDASLEAYKTATNWNSYADRIRPLSEIEGVVIEMGYELQQDGTITQNDKYFVVGFVPVNGGESITWGMPSGSGTVGYLVEYNAEGGRVDYWRGNTNSRTITTKSSTKKIKACFLVAYKEDSYIKDNTNSRYLWKGQNVE